MPCSILRIETMGAMDGWTNKHNNITLSNASMYETAAAYKRKSYWLPDVIHATVTIKYNIAYRFNFKRTARLKKKYIYIYCRIADVLSTCVQYIIYAIIIYGNIFALINV